MKLEGLEISRDAGVLTLAIANPPLNVLTQTVRASLGDLWQEVQQDRGVRSVLWRSGERAFCAGADLKEFPARFDPEVARAHGLNAHRMIRGLVDIDVPVTACIRGFCMGGGLELALGCSYRIAARTSSLALPEVRRGVWPGTGGTLLLARAVGASRAKELLCTGRTLTATEALQLGVVDEVVDDEELDPRGAALATEIARQPGPSLRTMVALVDRRFRAEFREHLEFELERFVQAYQLPEAREGQAAFFERRAPRWAHAG